MSDQHQSPVDGDSLKCVEHHVWTPLPMPPPKRRQAFTLRLREVDARAHDRIKAAGTMTFHMVGCAGDYRQHEPQRRVARAMAAQLHDPDSAEGPGESAAFLYHLGDVVYKDEDAQEGVGDDQHAMYQEQFYAPYADYDRPIFAIAGNHDGKRSADRRTSAIDHFLANFCAKDAKPSSDNEAGRRPTMTQPYPYWRLTTPLAYIIGLYSNIANGGMLDDPTRPDDRPQYHWLVDQLRDVQRRNAGSAPPRAVLLAVHYPPYSGTANFTQRGDPTLGPSHAASARPLGAILQEAFAESGQRPDAVFSAHAHLYQRLTYRHADGWEVPYLVAGSGGHSPVEKLWQACDGKQKRRNAAPLDAVLPPGLALPAGERVRVMAYNDRSFGFMRVTVAANRLVGEFFTVGKDVVALADAFHLDLESHRVAGVS